MADEREPQTLGDLLIALERSDNLRSLARECGMLPGDLRRSLKRWRRELQSDDEGEKRPKAKSKSKPASLPEELEGLPSAADLGPGDMPKDGEIAIWTDGASRGNPGPASVGVLFAFKDGTPMATHCETIGKCTNNVAEYRAVLEALRIAVDWGVSRVRLHLDSELVARQLSGQYRVKSPDLIPFYRQVVSLAQDIGSFQVRHVRRDKNTFADALANLALDS